MLRLLCGAPLPPNRPAPLKSWQQNRGANVDKWDQGKDTKQVSSLQTFTAFDVHMENGISILFHQLGQFDNFY